jgi:TrbL/VirB6 plasmid conjugal transfer protein
MKRFLVVLAPLVFNTALHAASVPVGSSGNAGVDWLYQFSNNLTDMVTANGGALTTVGLTELSFISFFVLVSMVIRWSVTGMTLSIHHQPLRVGDLTLFLLRLVFCCLLENYWVNPLPGLTFGFNHLFSWIAQVIVAALDQNSLTNLAQLFKQAGDGTPQPPAWALYAWGVYLLVQLEMAIGSGIIFLMNASAFLFYGVSALFGPLFIPLYMAAPTRQKFLNFVDVLLSLAMIRAVAAAFIFVWSGFLNTFISNTFHGDYSIGMWIAHLVPVTAVQFAFVVNMLFIPMITQMLFGGGAGAAARVSQLAETAAIGALGA